MQLPSYYNNNPNSIYNPSDNKTPSYNIDSYIQSYNKQ